MNLTRSLNPLSVRPGNGLLAVAALALSLNLACSGGSGGGGATAPPAAPTTPAITAPDNVTENQAGYAATTPAQAAGTTFAWTITSGGVIQGAATGTSITFTPDAFPGTVALSCVATNSTGASPAGTKSCTIVAAPVTPTITTPANVTASSTGNAASIASQAGCTYAWTITGGTITAGDATPSITFTAGASGSVALGCTVTNAANTASTPGTASSTIVAVATPIITAPTYATVSHAGYTASVQAGFSSYAWTITNGTITAGANTRTATFTAGASGTVDLDCTVTNAAGTPAIATTASSTIVAAPAITGFTNDGPIGTGATATLTGTFTDGTGVVTPGSLPIASGLGLAVTPAATTLYTLTVTNQANDSVTATSNVTVGASLTVTISGLTALDADVTITGPAGYSQPLTATGTLSGLAAGTYTVTAATVTDPTQPGLGRGNAGTLGPDHLQRYPLLPVQTVVVGATGGHAATVKYPDATLTVPGASFTMDFVLVPAGSFTMGSANAFDSNLVSALPTHPVTIPRAFYIAKYPCTQGQWDAVLTDNPSFFSIAGGGSATDDPTRPVDRVRWDRLRNPAAPDDGFLEALNILVPGWGFRLPSEAEYEYAVRAGTTTGYFFGETLTNPSEYVWWHAVSTNPVGLLKPNPWGLYDIVGNVWEWCEDDSHAGYAGAPADGSAWVDGPRGTRRILRGGSWSGSDDLSPRSAFRWDNPPTFSQNIVGFRLVIPVP